jgi:hypothetical protein
MLAQNERGETALHIAALRNHVEILQKLWIWAKDQMNPNDLRKKLLLAKDKYGYTAWHRAAERGNLVASGLLWSWAKKAKLNRVKLLPAQNKRGEMRDWAKEAQLNPNGLENKQLQAKDEDGNTTQHRVVRCGCLRALWIRIRN